MPKFLLAENKTFRTHHVIILTFFAVCSSLYFMVGGQTIILAGVYTIAFLSVMTLFAIGNLILKYKRSRIRREHHARVSVVLLALFGTLTALSGNIHLNFDNLQYFLLYFGSTLFLVGIMFFRVYLLRMLIRGLVRKQDGEEIDLTTDEVPKTHIRSRLAVTFISWLKAVQEQKIGNQLLYCT